MVAMTEAASGAFGTGGVTSVVAFLKTVWGAKSGIELLNTKQAAMSGIIDEHHTEFLRRMGGVDSAISKIHDDIGPLNTSFASRNTKLEDLINLVNSQNGSIKSLCDESHTREGEIIQIRADISGFKTTVELHVGTMGDLKEDIKGLAGGQSALGTAMAAIGERVTLQAGTMGDLRADMKGLAETVKSQAGTMGDLRVAMAGLGERVNSHTSTMDKMRTDIAGLEKKVDSQATMMGKMRTDIAGLEKKVDSQATMMGKMRTDIAGLEKKVDSQATMMGKMREDIAGLEKKVDSQATMMGEMREDIAGLEKKVDSQATMMGKMRTDIAGLEKKVDSQATMMAKTDEKLDEMGERQAKTDEKLDEMAERQAKTDEKLDEMAERQAKTDETLDKLHQSMDTMQGSLDKLIKMKEKQGLSAMTVMSLRTQRDQRLRTGGDTSVIHACPPACCGKGRLADGVRTANPTGGKIALLCNKIMLHKRAPHFTPRQGSQRECETRQV